MRHDWIFDVLSDLYTYATRNELHGLAAKVEDALVAARREISSGEGGPDEPPQSPPSDRKIH